MVCAVHGGGGGGIISALGDIMIYMFGYHVLSVLGGHHQCIDGNISTIVEHPKCTDDILLTNHIILQCTDDIP